MNKRQRKKAKRQLVDQLLSIIKRCEEIEQRRRRYKLLTLEFQGKPLDIEMLGQRGAVKY